MARICARCGENADKHIRVSGNIVGNNAFVKMYLCPHDQFLELEEAKPQQVEEKKKPTKWYIEFVIPRHGDKPYYLTVGAASRGVFSGNHWETLNECHAPLVFGNRDNAQKVLERLQPRVETDEVIARVVTEEEAIAELWRSRNKH